MSLKDKLELLQLLEEKERRKKAREHEINVELLKNVFKSPELMSLEDVEKEAEIYKTIMSYAQDPLGFAEYAIKWGIGPLKDKTLRKWQREKLAKLTELLKANKITTQQAIQMAIASGHGIGKSAFVALVILWAISTCVETRGVVTANTENQLKQKTWAELSKWYHRVINKHWFEFTATAIYSKNPSFEKTWRIDQVPWSKNNTEAFAGLHNEGKRILLIFDEASAIPDIIWEVSEGALTDDNTEILWLAFGNPTRNTGRFKDCFLKLKHRWHTEQIDSREVEGTNKTQFENWITDYGLDSDFVKVRVRGMFPSASMKQFISLEDVDAAYNRELKAEQYNFAPVILTVDPAWEGDDEFVIGKRQGLKYETLRTIPKNDNDVEMAGLIISLQDEHKADIVFIDGGYGTGVYSAAKTMGKTNWVIVWFAGKSSDLGCLNKRAEMYKLARDWLKEGGQIPKDPILHQELITPETVSRIDGKIQIESKKDIKARGFPSPNRADAFVLSFAQPVTAKPKPIEVHMPDYGSGGWMS
jgi:hypothetical protein